MNDDHANDEAYQKGVEKAAKINEKGYGTFYECCDLTFDNRTALRGHLEVVHAIDLAAQKFTRQMTMHMDGRDWFASSYSWSCDAVTFMQYDKAKRSRNDPFRSF